MPANSPDDFLIENPLDWKRLIDQLFPIVLPARAKWHNQTDIIATLKQISSVSSVNHMFFPDTGGDDLTDANWAGEDGFIAIECGSSIYYIKPISLSFESFGDRDNYQWNYFRLETEQVEDTGTYEDFSENGSILEQLLELSPGQYVSSSYGEERDDEDEKLPETARHITRLLGGSLVIFQKTSIYNQIPEAYNAPHNKIDGEKFRDEIAELRQDMINQSITRLRR